MRDEEILARSPPIHQGKHPQHPEHQCDDKGFCFDGKVERPVSYLSSPSVKLKVTFCYLRWKQNKTHCLVLVIKSRTLNLRKPPTYQPIEHSERVLLMYFEPMQSSW